MIRALVRATTTFLAVVVTVLLAAALMPLLFGWHSSVVLTGSMGPDLRPGDVVVTSSPPARLQPGQIIVFHDPVDPDHLIVHRFQHYRDKTSVITKGDANLITDTTAVPIGNVVGIARLRVPWIGMPSLWLHRL